MAVVRAFTKVLVKQGQSLLDGLLQRTHLPRVKLPKQKAVNVADLTAKASKYHTPPVAREWIRQYAWKTLASDLRKRAAWQFSGRAGGRLAEGQRWLLFPAYGFVGLSFASKSVSADEVDNGFDAVTQQVKGLFGQEAGETSEAGSPCGRLIARGSRVAVYKIDAPSDPKEESEKTDGVEDSCLETSISAPEEEASPEEITSPQTSHKGAENEVHINCDEVLAHDETSSVNVHFSTSDGRSYQVSLNLTPGNPKPVALTSVHVDGSPIQSDFSGGKIKRLLDDAMLEDKVAESLEAESDMSCDFSPYASLTSQSIEIIERSVVSDVLSDAPLQCTALDPRMNILSCDFDAQLRCEESPADLSLCSSDIVIIDDTVELDLQMHDLEEPVFLDDLAADPLHDLKFVNHYEAINYLQTSNDGAYLLMTYFPEAEDDDMQSLSLPDTGENLWDAYEEIFHGKAPAQQTSNDTANASSIKTQATLSTLNNAAHWEGNTQEAGVFHKVTAAEVKEAEVVEEKIHEPEPGAGGLEMQEMQESDEITGENGIETYVEISQKKPVKDEQNWNNRVVSSKEISAHPNILLIPDGEIDKSNMADMRVLCDELTASTISLLESVVLFTQITEAVAHIDQQGMLLRDFSSSDVIIHGGDSPWPIAAIAVDRARLYNKISPRHLSYRDAVKNPTGGLPAAHSHTQMIPQARDPGFSDDSSVMRSLALLGLELFGARSPLANEDAAREWTYPSHVPDVFTRLLDALLKPHAHKVFSARLLSYCLHLLLWCPQSYLQGRDLMTCKAQVMRWLSTFSAVTFLKSRSSDNGVKQTEKVKQQMKQDFLSTLDAATLSSAVRIVRSVM